jgi:Predicted ATPase
VYDDDREKLQEFVGYCLRYWGMPFNRALILTGPTHSGKSTFLNVVAALLGEDNVARQSLQDLSNSRFAAAELYGKYVNIRADLDTDTVENIGLFKEMAAGDTIRAERKFEHPFRFRVTQKQLYAANEVPNLAHEDDAFHERWIHVQFPETINKQERDSTLVERLTTDDELAGILNWALEGYARLMQQGGFTDERSIDNKRDIWRSEGDSIDQFVNAVLEIDTDATTPDSDVYDAYREFCDDIDRHPEAKQTPTKRLKREHDVTKRRPVIDSNQVWCYAGISLPDESSESEGEQFTFGEGF